MPDKWNGSHPRSDLPQFHDDQVHILVTRARLGVLDAVGGALDGLIEASHHAVFAPYRPPDAAAVIQVCPPSVAPSGHLEWNTAQSLRRLMIISGSHRNRWRFKYSSFWLIQDMTEISQIRWLSVNDRMKIGAGRADLIVMHARCELNCWSSGKQTARRCVQLSRRAALVHYRTAQVRRGS